MTESILTSIKKLLGIPENYTNFDTDIILFINSVFMSLSQLGVGPSTGFRINDDTETWEDFISEDNNPELIPLLSATKSYIHLKVKLLFDPPLSSAVMEATKQMIQELEWRLNLESESK